ncbi:plasmid replication protein RepC [Mangrovicoccus algicola]|uniref:Plasmid replication protein RepC n=1 Tax=Mangrovicoccus algicola TaxID=2771008 RepID=A0A8J6YZP7_9RHOB|nr:plasmid replication protein RepC [Mangrovicoccus algicola]MBE3638843.1 plasmid replication protein RepC [Mangrovicoccus algicola]
MSADNRFALMPALRQARAVLGLSPAVLATLEAMLTCLPKTGSAHVVFASNETLIRRRNGVSDRTIRRHVAHLAAIGLLRRCDSPNGKRYSRRNPLTGEMLRFGFDLSPLFGRADEIRRMAAAETARQEACDVLRLRIRTVLSAVPEEQRMDLLRRLRRRLSLEELEDILAPLRSLEPDTNTMPTPPDHPATELVTSDGMTATDSQSVRHCQRSNQETRKDSPSELRPDQIGAACRFALSFSATDISGWPQLCDHADRLASMMGIDGDSLRQAKARCGPRSVAKTLMLIAEMKSRVKTAPAYFRSVTTGMRAGDFDPDRLIARRLRAGAA